SPSIFTLSLHDALPISLMRERDLFELRGKIGMVFQESALFDSLSVRENVAYRLMEARGIYDEEIDRRVREALRFVELEHTLELRSEEHTSELQSQSNLV